MDEKFTMSIDMLIKHHITAMDALEVAITTLRECAKTNETASKALMEITELLREKDFTRPISSN